MAKESLVIEFPDWTQRMTSLFQRLDESPDLAAGFIENPGEMLAEHLGLERAARTVSPENHLLFEILRDPRPLAIPRETPENSRTGSGVPATYGELLRAVLARTKELPHIRAVQPGFDAAAALGLELAAGTALATRLEAELRLQLETRLEAELRLQLEARLETELRTQLEARLETELRLQLEARLEAELRLQLETRLEAELRLQLETRLEAELRLQLEARLETELRTQLEFRLETELRAQVEARIEAELRVQLDIETELRAALAAGLEIELRAGLAAGVGVGVEGPGGPGGSAIAHAAPQFSRFDLQRLSGFLASQYAPAVTRLVCDDGGVESAAS